MIGNAAGDVKSAKPAATTPIDGIWFCSISAMKPVECGVSTPISATTPSSTAVRPHSAAVLGSLFVSQTRTFTGRPPTPSCLLRALAAARAPSGISGFATPADFS